MPVQLARDTMKKLNRLIELRAVEMRHLGEDSPEMDAVLEEMRPLTEELTEDFLPIMEKLVDSGLIVVNVVDHDGRFMPYYEHIEATPHSVFENGCLWLVADLARDYDGGSVKRHRPGSEPLLHTWNAADGFEGKPTRKIIPWTGPYFERAYMAGGEGWGDGTKLGDILVVSVKSVKKGEKQSQAEYNYLFENYAAWEPNKFHVEDGIRLVECEQLDGGDYAAWDYELAIGKPSRKLNKQGRQNRIDYLIYNICQWHSRIMRRLKRRYQREQQA